VIGNGLIPNSSENWGVETPTKMTYISIGLSGASQGFATPKVDRKEDAETRTATSLLPDFKNGNHGSRHASGVWTSSQ
jgi:hypothetical protein